MIERLTRAQLVKAIESARTADEIRATLAQLRAYFRQHGYDPSLADSAEVVGMRALALGIDPIEEGRLEAEQQATA